MSIRVGTQLGSLEITALLGKGGMGEVYRARDLKLKRDVAIKILPDEFARDPDRVSRFQREAEVLASLNHPNIAAIYDLQQVNETRFLVLELVEGETLADRIARGPLPFDQLFTYAIQIVDALDKAHRQGVTHRDLKPGNIMLTKSGAKLLDFGLAKVVQPGGPVSQSSMPTVVTGGKPFTMEGAILGTLQYMSPEQLEGKETDSRTDIFAFGAVLYEMLTGCRAFVGPSRASLIAAIMSSEPAAVSELRPMTPAALDRVVKRCLPKARDDRWQTARDLCEELKWIGQARGGMAESEASAASHKSRRWQVGISALIPIVVAAVAGTAAWIAKPPPAAVVSRAVITMPSGDQMAGALPLVLSPDGLQIVYRGAQQLYLRSLDRFDAAPLHGTEDSQSPFFSPDGQWIGFFTGSKLEKVSVHGGAPVTLCQSIGSPNSASWGSHGQIVFSPRGGKEGLWLIPDSGGSPQTLTTPDAQKGEYAYVWPEFLPDGHAVIFTVLTDSSSEPAQIVALSLKTGERRVLIQGGTDAHYTPSGYLVYLSGGNLMAVPFDAKTLQVAASPIPVQEGVWHSESGGGLFSVSATGSLAYVPGGLQQSTSRFVWVDRKGRRTPLAAPPRDYGQFSLSPDGRQVAVSIPVGPRSDIWTYDIARNNPTRLTSQGLNTFPIWTPDGKWITFQSSKGGPMNLFRMPADLSGPEQQLTKGNNDPSADSWSPDGKELVFDVQDAINVADLWVMPANDFSKARPWLRTTASELRARFSPNGRWLAYISNETGRFEVYVRPFAGPGGKQQISTEGGLEPLWAPTGKELFYRSGRKMMVVEVTTDSSFTKNAPRLLFEGQFVAAAIPIGRSAISPDGERFLMLEPVDSSQPANQMNIVLNWSEELKKKVARGK
jgi:Tol biopolymer transport system component